MFNPQTPPPAPTGSPFTPPPPPFVPDAPLSPPGGGSDAVRTMPQRFMPGEPGRPRKTRGWVVVVVVALVVLVVGAAAYLLLSGQIFTPAGNANGSLNTNTVFNVNTGGNANGAANANGTANANATVNASANTNGESNGNANGNVNAAANTNAGSNANANSNTNSTVTVGSPLPSTTDTDGDGLTDVEEALYGTDVAKTDTDGDGFIDGRAVTADGKLTGEVALGYDPTAASRKLDAAGLVRTYSNTPGGYAVLYPSNWVFQNSDTVPTGVTIVPDKGTGELFQISVTDNPGNLPAKDWYQSLNPGLDLSNESSFTVNGLDAFQSLDDSTVFYSRGGKIYALTYNTDGLDLVNYRTTFIMMLHSFRLTGTTTNTNG